MECECGTDLKGPYNFCPACRRVVNAEFARTHKPEGICPKCGCSYAPDALYCSFCGEPNKFVMARIIFNLGVKK